MRAAAEAQRSGPSSSPHIQNRPDDARVIAGCRDAETAAGRPIQPTLKNEIYVEQ